jgi:hypothetical protein
MTYGQLKFRLTKAFPGVDLDLIEGWCNDRYFDLLGELAWSRQNVEGMLLTTAPYVTGTVAVTMGSTAVTLTAGSWTASMNGLAFRVVGRSEFYEFTFASSTVGALDRPFEGPTSTAIGYSIFQHIYPLPANCRMLEDDALSNEFGPMERMTHAELNLSDPRRVASGIPMLWASYMDDSSVPPNMQVELYPVPDRAVGIPFTYVANAGALKATSQIIQIWMQPAALIEGVTAKIKMHLKDYAGAQLHAAAAASALATMKKAEAQRLAPAHITLDSYYTRHRSSRCRG